MAFTKKISLECRSSVTISLGCYDCKWWPDFLEEKSVVCPKCNAHTPTGKRLRFGGLYIDCYDNKFLLICPQTKNSVKIDTADIPETIKFMINNFEDQFNEL